MNVLPCVLLIVWDCAVAPPARAPSKNDVSLAAQFLAGVHATALGNQGVQAQLAEPWGARPHLAEPWGVISGGEALDDI